MIPGEYGGAELKNFLIDDAPKASVESEKS